MLIQHPRFHAVDLEFVLRCGVAVDEGQVSGGRTVPVGMEDNDAAAAGHFQDMTVEVESDLAEEGEGGADVDVAGQADDVHSIVRQSRFQLHLIRHGDIQPAGEGEVLGDECGFLPLRAVLVPAIEGVAELGGVGQGDLIAGLQDLGGVVLVVVEVVGHGETVNFVPRVFDTAVERAAGDAAIIVSINIHGIRAHSASRAADDLHIAADSERTGVRDAAAIQ